MYSDEDLDSAVAAGALSAEAAAAFQAHVAEREPLPTVDEERFRLVNGFSDVFVVVASALLLTSIGWIGNTIRPCVGALAVGVAAWALAEFFTRRRRMALLAIGLAFACLGGAFFSGFLFFERSSGNVAIASTWTAFAAWLYWLRFRVPITVAAGTAAVVSGVIGTVVSLAPNTHDWVSPLMFLAGLAVFGYALRWDASDPQRRTYRSDVAFWLHLLAAPLLVDPVFTKIGALAGPARGVQMLWIVVLYAAIAFVSLAIDRRALLLSALCFVLYACTALLNKSFVGLGFAITGLVLGSALLLLSAFWQKSRALALQSLPAAFQARLAPLR